MYEEIIECLQSNNFLNEIERRGYRKTYKDTNVFELFKETISLCGLSFPYDKNSPEWRTVWKLLINPSHVPKKQKHSNTEAKIITPLAAIYIALYEIYGYETPRIAYELLEGDFVSALTGDNKEISLLVAPITPATVNKQIELVKKIIQKEPQLCSTLPILFCGVSHKLPRSYSLDCLRKIQRICAEVNSNE